MFLKFYNSAEEVREYATPMVKPDNHWLPRKHKVNLSTIREKYRDSRIHERYTEKKKASMGLRGKHNNLLI